VGAIRGVEVTGTVIHPDFKGPSAPRIGCTNVAALFERIYQPTFEVANKKNEAVVSK